MPTQPDARWKWRRKSDRLPPATCSWAIDKGRLVKAARTLWVGGILCLGGIVVGAYLRAPTATGSAAGAESQAESRVVANFTDFAGSESNARSLIAGLRQGSEITLTAPGPYGKAATITRFTLPTRPMDYGNVRTSLTLAREQLAQLGINKPTPVQIKAVLAGGAVTSRGAARSTSVLLPGVLQMRAHGMGWHKIADSMGVKLDDAKAGTKPSPVAAARSDVPAASLFAAGAVTLAVAQGEAPKQSRTGGTPDTGASASTRPGKVAGIAPTVAAKSVDTKPADSENRRAPAPAGPDSVAVRVEKGGAGKDVTTAGPASAALSQETGRPGSGATAARENGIAGDAAAPVEGPVREPVALSPATRLEMPGASGENSPEPAAPAD